MLSLNVFRKAKLLVIVDRELSIHRFANDCCIITQFCFLVATLFLSITTMNCVPPLAWLQRIQLKCFLNNVCLLLIRTILHKKGKYCKLQSTRWQQQVAV